MALTVSNLYKKSMKYNMKLLAGEEGLNNLVQWVHIIETNEGARFLHGQEIVITEGVRENEEERLLTLIKTIFSLNASALIINTGMFIKKVPTSAIDFCNENGFPLFSIPWEVPLVDVTREFCQRIIDNAVREENISTIFKNLIFNIGDKSALIHQMERFGYMTGSTMMFICISMELEKGTEEFASKSSKVKLMAESSAKAIKDQYISFEYQEKKIIVLIDYAESEIETYIDNIFKKLSAGKVLPYIYIGIGDNIKGLENQDANFMRAYAACEIACKKQEHVLKYQELGLYKLLVNVGRTEVLADFYQNSLGRLIAYDKENGTDYHGFIKAYIECDGHQGDISDKLFIHRNTVNNYIRKVEEITGMNLFSVEGKAKLYAAYCIEDLL